jgi:hypothetical protein
VHCSAVSSRSPGLGIVLGTVAAWVVLITALHVTVNGRGLGAGTPMRAVQVGGLPVT